MEQDRNSDLFSSTADEYGDNEDLIGKWFAANPEKRKYGHAVIPRLA